MAIIKSYTSLEQSKKLAEFLPLESADMVYFGIHQGIDGKYHLSGTNTEDDVVPIYKNFCIKVFAKITASDVINQLPCWSLAALLNILPNNKHITTSISKGSWQIDPIKYLPNTWWCEYEDNERLTEFNISADNPIDACVSMILKLYELQLL